MDIEEKDNLKKDNLFRPSDNSWLRPIIIFYVKTTSWIIFPLVIGFLTANYFNDSFKNQTLFFLILMLSFGITCFGIYKEIKTYKNKIK